MVDQAYLDAIIQNPITRVLRRVDIYESDATTPWMLNARLSDGTVSVDQTRVERRTLEISLHDEDGSLKSYPDGFWYDKVIKVYRGVRTPDAEYFTSLGSFMPDSTDRPHFPNLFRVAARDFTKKLINSKFATPTAWVAGQSLEGLIKAIALNAGITKFILPNSGITTTREFFFEKNTSRWDAIKELATAYSYEVYINPDEYLVVSSMQDPVTSPTVFTFQTGPNGTISKFSKRTNDSLLKNHVGVSSEATDRVPIYVEAINTEPSSPTRVSKIGDRYWDYSSALIETQQQAQTLANNFLSVMALEQFDVTIESLVLPWLEVGNIVKFLDPDPAPTDPDRFLLSSLNIPLMLGTMTAVCRRVTIVK